MIKSNNELQVTERAPNVDPEYFKRNVYRYIWCPESVNVSDRVVVHGGAKVFPAGELIEISDIPIPYYDSDTLQDERENADVAIANRNSPTGGAKFRFKTSYAIVAELMEAFGARGMMYLQSLTATTAEERKAAAMAEARLDMPNLVNAEIFPLLQDAVDDLQRRDASRLPQGEALIGELTQGLRQAIAFREAWAESREAEIQQALKGKPGRSTVFPIERAYALTVGIRLSDAHLVIKRDKSPIADVVKPVQSPGVDESIAAKLLLDQNEQLQEENLELRERLGSLEQKMAEFLAANGGSKKK